MSVTFTAILPTVSSPATCNSCVKSDCSIFSFSGSKENILENESVKERELFISDATDIYPVTALRFVDDNYLLHDSMD